MTQLFIVHHNPNNGRYRYDADPTDALASAQALVDAGEGIWVAGNCRRMLRVGDLLLFKFGGAHLQQEPGIYAAAWVIHAPVRDPKGTWILRYVADARLTRRLMRSPIVGTSLARVVSRSFGASIQSVSGAGRAAALAQLGSNARPPDILDAGERIKHGLLILKEPLDKILAGTKTWEIRGKATAMRGSIALIESKSGHVVGTCEVIDVVGPLSLADLRRNARRAGFLASRLPYPTTYAWVIRNARRLAKPVPYRHPSGAVIWVRLAPSVVRRVVCG